MLPSFIFYESVLSWVIFEWYSTLYHSNLAKKLNICLHHFDVQRKTVSPVATHRHTPSNLKKSIILTTYMPSFCNFASNPDPAKRPHLQETDVTSEKEMCHFLMPPNLDTFLTEHSQPKSCALCLNMLAFLLANSEKYREVTVSTDMCKTFITS